MMDLVKKKIVVYIHGKGGNAKEAEHYQKLFPECEVTGFDYHSSTPWDARKEFGVYFDDLRKKYSSVILIANSIGAFFSLCSLAEKEIEKAYFISPIVNMEQLITDMMKWAGVSEDELCEQGIIETVFGETLSFEYLSWVRANPFKWRIPTAVLYGNKDNLQSAETVTDFVERIGADLTVMEGGEHWFHTEEQMKFLDRWISSGVL